MRGSDRPAREMSVLEGCQQNWGRNQDVAKRALQVPMNRIFHVCMKRKENLVYILAENPETISCNVNHYHVKREANVVWKTRSAECGVRSAECGKRGV